MKGPEYSKESWPEFALQLPEVEEVLLLDGEGAALEELATTRVLAALFKVEVGDSAGPPGPHWPGTGWFQGTASAKGEANSVSSRIFDGCIMPEYSVEYDFKKWIARTEGVWCKINLQIIECYGEIAARAKSAVNEQ